MVRHHLVRLSPKPRGFHLVTDEVMTQIELPPGDGLLQLLIQHTSAGLTLNENADPDVRHDMALYFEQLAPENLSGMRHTLEGPDDMPAHVKGTLSGFGVSLPFRDGALLLGTWQGIYLCEYRNRGGGRRIVATVIT